MKQLSWPNRIVYFLNILLAILTFMAYFLPFLAPKVFPLLSVFTLILPLLLILNVLFFGWWAMQFRRQVLLSGIVLLLGMTFISKFYKFGSSDYQADDGDFKVMSYNVRLFNKFEWSEKTTVPIEISDFVKEHQPDILCIQEYSGMADFDISAFPYRYIAMHGVRIATGQAIFSKYPIIAKGEIPFPDTSNSAIYADVIKGKDTVRVYNMHLQSIKISPDVHEIEEDVNGINQKKSQMMLRRMSNAFRRQQVQAEMLREHRAEWTHKLLICGDMNNSAFSYVYRTIRGDLNDTFEEAGSGFGKSYDFKYYPARIDYIFSDPSYEVRSFRNFPEIQDSDHFPILAVLTDKKA